MTRDAVIVFTDGACSGNPGPGGWGAVLVSPLGKVRELGGGERQTTNNRMEMTAALEALLSLLRVKTLSAKKVRLYTDSKYLIQGITAWIHGWKKNGWKTAAGKDVTNRDLWEKLHAIVLAKRFEVEWSYVPGHQGYGGNERCDEIAVAFAKDAPIDLYTGDLENYPVDVKQLPKPAPLNQSPKKKGAAVYLSFVNGKLHRDKDWKSCEARVHGVPGAKFKKIESPEEEENTLKAWGLA